jgi:GT2 family glycosyltransferase
MKLGIITLNYNNSQETINLIGSLSKQTDLEFEVIIIDNASEDIDFTNLQNKIKSLKNNLPIQIIRNEKNLGFSGGNNIGIRQALENNLDWIILINNDIILKNNFIELLKSILATKESEIVGIPLLENGKKIYCGLIEWLKPTLKHIYDKHKISSLVINKKTGFKINNLTFYAIGGAVAIHKNVFNKIGYWDENYFLYFEDADFSIRALQKKIEIYIPKNLNIYHKISSTTKKLGSPTLLYYHYRNALYFNFKNGSWYIKLLVPFWSLFICLKQMTKIILNIDPKESKGILIGVKDFWFNRMGQISSSL